MNELELYKEKVFDDIKHIDKYENEYWFARELMPLFEYSKWKNFNNVVKKQLLHIKTVMIKKRIGFLKLRSQ